MIQSVLWARSFLAVMILGLLGAAPARAVEWDNFSDTWPAVDGLGRTLPGHDEVGGPRPDRTVGIFYFLWLGPHSQQGGPWDVSKILAEDPGAMENPNSPLWGPMYVPHHWGESIFGYYRTDDPYVLRRHAQMLSDAGVDVVIFDVTNQHTYRDNYMALLREWSAVRALGNRTPQVAFLCPFWDPAKVVRELYRDLYQPGIHPDLWFRWEGKPLILADPARLDAGEKFSRRNHPEELQPGATLGQIFQATNTFTAVAGSFPTWRNPSSAMTLRLRQGGPEGEIIAEKRFPTVEDNAWAVLPVDSQPAGDYYLEMSDPQGQVGWWSHTEGGYPRGEAFANGQPVPGDRNLQVSYIGSDAEEIREFFTFRRPQPDYFQGPVAPNMWSWLEQYPQHIFTNSAGIAEQMSVGVAQNAVSNRLGSLSEPGALGRNYHGGKWDTRPGAVNWGFNFAEQFERALKVDPRFIFITGWNEWIAGRHPEFGGIKRPVLFVDQFDQLNSRDIEPMRGGHGDHYYYQMISFIRRYKGVRPPPHSSGPKTISLNQDFSQWEEVKPEFRDDRGDTFHRDFHGYAHHRQYTNDAGRNDIIASKATHDDTHVYFHLRTREPLSPSTGPNWMWLLIDTDNDSATGWEGFDLVLNRQPLEEAHPTETILESNQGGWTWREQAKIPLRIGERELHLAIPRRHFKSPAGTALQFNFKWADNMPANGEIITWLTGGDTAPNARFRYRYDASLVSSMSELKTR